MREKKRYLVYEITTASSPSATTVATSLMNAFLQYAGEHGTAIIGPVILTDSYNQKTKRGIVRVSAEGLDLAKASLVFITNIDGKTAGAQSVTVSGAIGTAKKAVAK